MEFSGREGAALSPGAGVSQRSPEAAPPQGVLNFKHIEEAVQSLGPFSFTRFLRSYNTTCNSGRPTRSPPGVSVVSRHFSPRDGRGVSPGPTLSRPPMSLHTTKVSSSRNRSRGLVTRGMSVDPAVGSRAALFNPRDQT